MAYFKRTISLQNLLEKKSFFLLGPRGTGKSTLIRHQLGEQATIINLLKAEQFLRLSAHPEQLEDLIRAAQNKPFVVIDEIQKIPILFF